MSPSIVLYYEPTSGYGGSSRSLLSLLKNIDRAAFTPVVLSHYKGPAFEAIRTLDIPVIRILRLRLSERTDALNYAVILANTFILDALTALRISMLVIRHRPALIHLNSNIALTIPGILAAACTRTPCVCHLHEIRKPVSVERFFARFLTHYIVLTRKAHAYYHTVFPGKRFEVIENGVDPERQSASSGAVIRQELEIDPQAPLAVAVGRLTRGKGFSDFIEAAHRVGARYPGSRFIIVGSAAAGDRDYEAHLKALAADPGLNGRVVFTGWREDAKEIIAACDVLVQPSSTFKEGFGLTVVEAMARGKPVVVTDIPGPSEIVDDGVNGYVVPPSNPEKLAEAIQRLFSDPPLARRMGEAGRQTAGTRFSAAGQARKMETYYKAILRGANI